MRVFEHALKNPSESKKKRRDGRNVTILVGALPLREDAQGRAFVTVG
jgi:hypothetical protein